MQVRHLRPAVWIGALALGITLAQLTGTSAPRASAAEVAFSAVERALTTPPAPTEAGPAPDPGPYEEEPAIEHDPLGERWRSGLVMTGATPHRLLLFTFDDGPHRINTPRLLDMLDGYGVKAVFFLTSSRMDGPTRGQQENAEIAREIARRGHVIGNHTLSHQQLPDLSEARALEQVEGGQAIFERVLGRRPWLFRPPGGNRVDWADALVEERGYTMVMWNVGAGDFLVETPEQVFYTWKRVLARRERDDGHRGGIVLLHDTYDRTIEAFPMIMDEIRRRNCRLLAEGEELYDIVDDPAFFYAPRGRQPHGAEAPPARLTPGVLAARQARLREVESRRCGQADPR